MKRSLVLASLALMVLAACRKSPDLDALQNNQVVVTDRDKDANYGSYLTYHISDTVRIVATNPNDSILVGAGAKQMVDVVKANMNSRGYTFVSSKANNPDLGLTLVVIKDLERTSICSGWWGGWWGWYPWWGYYYPWCGSYTYSVGTSALTLFDLKNANTNLNIRAIWGMTAFGVFSTTNDATNVNLTTDAINQAFSQSPYIKR